MRDYVISGMLLALAGFAIPWAAVGLLAYYWITFMSVQHLMWGASSIRFALIIAAATVLGYLVSVTDRRPFWSFPFTVCLALALWMCVTTLFALSPDRALDGLSDYLKIITMMFLTAGIIKSRATLHALCWIICISVGYYSTKYGSSVLMGSHVYLAKTGIESPIAGDTNQLARAFVFIIPILIYLYSQSPWTSVRIAIGVVIFMSIMGLIGTNSRGGLVSFVVVIGLVWMQTRRKFSMIVIVGLMALVTMLAVSSNRLNFWLDRIKTIESYETDPSFQSRVEQWNYAAELADARLTGGGFSSDLLTTRYDGGTRQPRAYHSNYFQILGDHGWPGLALYVLLLLSTWRLGSAVMAQTRDHAELYWAHDLAAMIRVSMAGYMVGGLAITHAYYEPFFVLVGALTVLRGIVQRAQSSEERQETVLADGADEGREARRAWRREARWG